MSSHPQRPLLSSARGSQPTTLFATPACAAEIWSPCRALVDLGILASSLRGTWDSVLSQSGVDATRKSWRKTWARTSTSILPPRMPQRSCSVWAGRERFLQQEPVVMPWDHLCPVLQPAASSSWSVYRRTRSKLNAFPLVFGGRSIYGSLTGTPIDGEDTLAFSVLENIRPMIETVPLEQAADAYARMMQGKARFRMVLVTGQ